MQRCNVGAARARSIRHDLLFTQVAQLIGLLNTQQKYRWGHYGRGHYGWGRCGWRHYGFRKNKGNYREDAIHGTHCYISICVCVSFAS